jgi:hypothetical protein
VAEPIAGHVVVTHFDNEFRPQRLPFAAALRAPTAGPAWGLTGETGSGPQTAKLFCQRRPLVIGDRGREADMVSRPRGL